MADGFGKSTTGGPDTPPPSGETGVNASPNDETLRIEQGFLKGPSELAPFDPQRVRDSSTSFRTASVRSVFPPEAGNPAETP